MSRVMLLCTFVAGPGHILKGASQAAVICACHIEFIRKGKMFSPGKRVRSDSCATAETAHGIAVSLHTWLLCREASDVTAA